MLAAPADDCGSTPFAVIVTMQPATPKRILQALGKVD